MHVSYLKFNNDQEFSSDYTRNLKISLKTKHILSKSV